MARDVIAKQILIINSLALADDKIPITDPYFYSDETRCPDSLIERVFRKADPSREPIALLKERIAIMRDVGKKLCDVGFFLFLRLGLFDDRDRRYYTGL